VSIVLAIDTATIEISAALADESGLLAAFARRGTRTQVETLHPAIDELFRHTGIRPDAISAVAVDCGPGRFTGLRVGIAAAKAFAFGCSVPLVTATSTELLRIGATATDPASTAPPLRAGATTVVPIIDMRRGEVAFELPGTPGPSLATPDALAVLLAGLDGEVLVVGDGARRYGAELQARVPGLLVGGDAHAAPNAAVLARLGVLRLARDETSDAVAALPLYLRGADVRIGWETRTPETGPVAPPRAPSDPALPGPLGPDRDTDRAVLVDGKGAVRP